MKTAIYIEDGITQLVLTPENDFEKNALVLIKEGKNRVLIQEGTFYACQGGYVRQSPYGNSLILYHEKESE